MLRRVDFPTPDGPDSTKGLRKSKTMVVEDIADRFQHRAVRELERSVTNTG